MNIYRCPECMQEFQSAAAGLVKCPLCGGTVRVERLTSAGAPWDTGIGGWFNAYIQTIKLSLTQPVLFFEDVGRGDGIARPLFFALINAFIVALVVAAYQVGFQSFMAGTSAALNWRTVASPLAALSVPFAMLLVVAGLTLALPALTCAALFISSGIYHLCLMVLGAANRPLAQTFRVVCYATGPQLAQILPLAGQAVAGIWQLVLTIIGLKVVHQTGYGRTVLAVFLPLMLCCGILMLFVVVIVGGIAGAILSSL